MRAAVFSQPNQPMTVEDLAMPEPHEREVRVKVAACGVCHADLHVLKGEVAFPTPGVLGHEISGVVDAIGPGVTNVTVRPGQSVAVFAVGGVGTQVLQMARAFGAAQVIAVGIRGDKLEKALEMGATHAVNGASEDASAACANSRTGAASTARSRRSARR